MVRKYILANYANHRKRKFANNTLSAYYWQILESRSKYTMIYSS